jgi:hypothetical protein
MKIIDSTVTFIGALVGLIGGGIWAYNTNYDYEPIILVSLSTLTILGFIISKLFFGREVQSEHTNTKNVKQVNKQKTENTQNVEVNVSVGESKVEEASKNIGVADERNATIEAQKPKTHILFIDDDTKFNTVKIFKDSGWKNTKTVKDIKSIDLQVVQNANIVFVDINGVGKLLKLEYEGLDLAYMIKQKYPEKKVVIYSAKKDANSFHKAWDVIDARIEKNALPIQFQNVADNYCLSKN